MSLRTVIALSACGFLTVGSIGKAEPFRLGDAELDTVTAGQLALEEFFSGGRTAGELPSGLSLGDLLGLLPGSPVGGGGNGTPPETTPPDATPPVDEGISTVRPERPSSLERSRSRNRAALDAPSSVGPAGAAEPSPVFARFAALATPDVVAFVRNSGQAGSQAFDQLFVALQGDGVFASAGVSASSSG